MKNKSLMVIVVAVIGISLAIPATSQARRFGWYGAGAFAGGVLLGTALARPWYYAPRPVYVYPAPTVVYAAPPPVYVAPPPVYAAPPVYVPNQAYAYPDPALTARAPSAPQEGQWIEVPGQSVNGRWVQPHKVWVPDRP